MHMTKKIVPTYEHDYKDEFDTQFRHVSKVVAYDSYFADPQMDLTPVGMKTYKIKTNGSEKILRSNLLIKLKVMTSLRIHMYQTHNDMHQ